MQESTTTRRTWGPTTSFFVAPIALRSKCETCTSNCFLFYRCCYYHFEREVANTSNVIAFWSDACGTAKHLSGDPEYNPRGLNLVMVLVRNMLMEATRTNHGIYVQHLFDDTVHSEDFSGIKKEGRSVSNAFSVLVFWQTYKNWQTREPRKKTRVIDASRAYMDKWWSYLGLFHRYVSEGSRQMPGANIYNLGSSACQRGAIDVSERISLYSDEPVVKEL